MKRTSDDEPYCEKHVILVVVDFHMNLRHIYPQSAGLRREYGALISNKYINLVWELLRLKLYEVWGTKIKSRYELWIIIPQSRIKCPSFPDNVKTLYIWEISYVVGTGLWGKRLR